MDNFLLLILDIIELILTPPAFVAILVYDLLCEIGLCWYIFLFILNFGLATLWIVFLLYLFALILNLFKK